MLFEPQELVRYGLVLTEKLSAPRSSAMNFFAVYMVRSLGDSFAQIAGDFGYVPAREGVPEALVKSPAEIKEIRRQEFCCVRPNRFYNPYKYRGLLIYANEDANLDELQRSGLQQLLPKARPVRRLNIQFTACDSHFLDFGEDAEKFSELYFGQAVNAELYAKKTAARLYGSLRLLGIRSVSVRAQLQSHRDICALIQQEFERLWAAEP